MITYPKLQKYAAVRVGWGTMLLLSVGGGKPISEVSGSSGATKCVGVSWLHLEAASAVGRTEDQPCLK